MGGVRINRQASETPKAGGAKPAARPKSASPARQKPAAPKKAPYISGDFGVARDSTRLSRESQSRPAAKSGADTVVSGLKGNFQVGGP